jgi:homoserine acetyltransferase
MNRGLWLGAALGWATVIWPPPAIAHWPDQPAHQFADLGEFEFEGGGKVPNLRMSYVTHGKLNAAKRALRAILKATDVCASQPQRATWPITSTRPATT